MRCGKRALTGLVSNNKEKRNTRASRRLRGPILIKNQEPKPPPPEEGGKVIVFIAVTWPQPFNVTAA